MCIYVCVCLLQRLKMLPLLYLLLYLLLCLDRLSVEKRGVFWFPFFRRLLLDTDTHILSHTSLKIFKFHFRGFAVLFVSCKETKENHLQWNFVVAVVVADDLSYLNQVHELPDPMVHPWLVFWLN